MKIAIACDHGALVLKDRLKEYLLSKNYEVIDCGTYTLDSCDYPDYCALVDKPEIAKLTREHNDANVLALGACLVDFETTKKIVDTFLNTPFSNGERHMRRINKIMALEE